MYEILGHAKGQNMIWEGVGEKIHNSSLLLFQHLPETSALFKTRTKRLNCYTKHLFNQLRALHRVLQSRLESRNL